MSAPLSFVSMALFQRGQQARYIERVLAKALLKTPRGEHTTYHIGLMASLTLTNLTSLLLMEKMAILK